MPPVVRLTNLGIRQVHAEFVEAGLAFGCTSRQLLFKVQLPNAMPSIMAGINQTIMLSLSMVVIASMIGAGGLGNTVLTGIQRLNVGLGFEEASQWSFSRSFSTVSPRVLARAEPDFSSGSHL